MAVWVDTWPEHVIVSFASQYGSPAGYTLIERAKLLGTYGDVARLIDIVQQAVLAPFAKKGKPPKPVLPKEQKTSGHMSDEYKAYLVEVLGINRQGEGLEENAIGTDYSNSVD